MTEHPPSTASRPARGSVLARAAFCVAVVVNVVALYAPRAASTGDFSLSDKVGHVLVFAAVAATGCWARLPLRPLVGLLVANAVVSELVQHWLLPHRSGDPWDTVADCIGIGLGLLVGRRLGGVAPGRRGGTWGHERDGGAGGADRETARRHPGAG